MSMFVKVSCGGGCEATADTEDDPQGVAERLALTLRDHCRCGGACLYDGSLSVETEETLIVGHDA